MGGAHLTAVIGVRPVTGMDTIMATGGVIQMDTGLAIVQVTGIHRGADPHNMPAELPLTIYITTGHRESGDQEIQIMIQRQEIG